jgi:hypothetical protein
MKKLDIFGSLSAHGFTSFAQKWVLEGRICVTAVTKCVTDMLGCVFSSNNMIIITTFLRRSIVTFLQQNFEQNFVTECFQRKNTIFSVL